MHQLSIRKLGPIQSCTIKLKQYTVLTGYQASGKSTIAKALYFFRSLKVDLFSLLMQHELNGQYVDHNDGLVQEFQCLISSKFLNTFGSSYSMDPDMCLLYHYSDTVYIRLSLKNSPNPLTPNIVWVEMSDELLNFLHIPHHQIEQHKLKLELDQLFCDPFETVYIPAGRSVLTVLGSQFNYFYSTMDDTQKRLLDSCTRDYLERVMKIRPQFSNGLVGILEGQFISDADKPLYIKAIDLIQFILKGKYSFSDGEERIWVEGNHYVKINFASSGQQEVIWIVNLLFYYLVLKKRVFFIIEEPESNLFPDSQKAIVELISLVTGNDNSILVTTHSPYVLGAFNNLLYAHEIGQTYPDQVKQIIDERKWIDLAACDALFVRDGQVENCIDDDIKQIDNSLLDEISHDINREYDELFTIEQNEKGE